MRVFKVLLVTILLVLVLECTDAAKHRNKNRKRRRKVPRHAITVDSTSPIFHCPFNATIIDNDATLLTIVHKSKYVFTGKVVRMRQGRSEETDTYKVFVRRLLKGDVNELFENLQFDVNSKHFSSATLLIGRDRKLGGNCIPPPRVRYSAIFLVKGNGNVLLDKEPDTAKDARINLHLVVDPIPLNLYNLDRVNAAVSDMAYRPRPPLMEEPCEKTFCRWGATCLPLGDGTADCSCPENCPAEYEPVCSTASKTYRNHCELRKEVCQKRLNTRLRHLGQCELADPCLENKCPVGGKCTIAADGRTAYCLCPATCPAVLDRHQVCGSDGREYQSSCELDKYSCEMELNITLKFQGKCDPCADFPCPEPQICILDESRNPTCRCDEVCELDLNPVCGSDGKTYANECDLRQESCRTRQQIRIIYRGKCSSGDHPCSALSCGTGERCSVDRKGVARCSCGPSCELLFRPVCAGDGRTFDSECELRRMACLTNQPIQVAYSGSCEKENVCSNVSCEWGGSCSAAGGRAVCVCPSCNGALAAVCASDGHTYGNECKMRAHACAAALDLAVAYDGPCETCDVKKCDHYSVCKVDSVTGRPICVCPDSCNTIDIDEEPGLSADNLKVCGSDGNTYDSECFLKMKSCQEESNITIAFRGPCELCSDVQCKYGARCSAGECVCPEDCTEVDAVAPEPVCSNTMITYPSECELQRASCHLPVGIQLHVIFYGDCKDRFSSMGTPTLLRAKLLHPKNTTVICENSRFGCCTDQTTPAMGPNLEGCPPPCNCNKLGSISDSCNPETLKCLCKPGVGGNQCDRCEPGFWGLPKISTGQFGCIPCACSVFGSIREDCEQMTGRCICKPRIEGLKCTKCANSIEMLGPNGCYDINVGTTTPSSCLNMECYYGASCTEIGVSSPVCQCPETNCSQKIYGYPNTVCGSDGQTYESECHLRLEACRSQLDVVMQTLGACGSIISAPASVPFKQLSPIHFTQQDDNSPSKSTRHLLGPDQRYYYNSKDLKQNSIIANISVDIGLSAANAGEVGALLGDLCSVDVDCAALAGVHCSNYACLCIPGYIPNSDRKGCIEYTSNTIKSKPPYVHNICLSNPCHNNGSCVALTAAKYLCICDKRSTGEKCESNKGFEVPSFGGDSFIRLKPLKAYHKLDIDAELKVYSESGLILYDQQRPDGTGDFVSLAVLDGYVQFRYNLGDGMVVLKSPEKLKLNEYYKLSAKRYHKDAILSVSGMEDVVGQSVGDLKYLDLSDDAYVGKVPTNFTRVFTNIGTAHGLNGCIKQLRVIRHQVTKRIDTNTDGHLGQIISVHNILECSNSSCSEDGCEAQDDPCAANPCGESDDVVCEPLNMEGYLCRCIFGGHVTTPGVPCSVDALLNETANPAPSFDGNSLIIYPNLEGLEKTFRIEIWLLTRKSAGMVLYAAQSDTGKGDFLSLNLVDSKLQLKFNLGSGVANLTHTSAITKDIWHKVIITRIGRKATLQVNNLNSVAVHSPPTLVDLNLMTPLFIGSLPNFIKAHRHSGVKHSFIGSIQRIIVNSKALNIFDDDIVACNLTPTESVLPCASSGVTKHKGYPCGVAVNPCQRGGTCLPVLNEYKCVCQLRTSGRNCENRIIHGGKTNEGDKARLGDRLRLDRDTTYIYKHKTTRRSLRLRRGLRFEIMLRTDEISGLLLWKKHGKNEIFTISLSEGFVEVSYSDKHQRNSNITHPSFNKVTSNVRVDDGLWHTVLAKRRKRLVLLQIDNSPALRSYSSQFFTSSANAKVWIGGAPNVDAYSRRFSGCITNLKVNGEHIELLKPVNKNVQIEVC